MHVHTQKSGTNQHRQIPPLSRGPFSKHAKELLLRGYSPLPIRPGTKKPSIENWSSSCIRPLDTQATERLSREQSMAGLGVACGFNCLVGFDVDSDDPEIATAIKSVLPDALIGKRGQRGYTAFFRSERPMESRRFRSLSGGTIAEILGIGRQSVLPPTIHPDTGEPYRWLSEKTLFDTALEALPLISGDIAERIETAIVRWIEKPEERIGSGLTHNVIRAGDLSELDKRRYEGFAETAIAERTKELAATKEGARNQTLFRDICYLGKFVRHGIVSRDVVMERFCVACRTNGLVRRDGLSAVVATINSALFISRNDPLRALVDRPRPNNGQRADPQNGRDTPVPLPNALPTVASFDLDLIPRRLRPWADDIATVMQVPLDYIAVGIMTGLSAVIGRQVAIRPQSQTDWAETANLWALMIGRPGLMKTPSMEKALAPLKMLAAREMERYEQEMKEVEPINNIN